MRVAQWAAAIVITGSILTASVGMAQSNGPGATPKTGEPTFGMVGHRVHIYVPKDRKLTVEVVPCQIGKGPEVSVAVRHQSRAGAPILLGVNNYVPWINAKETGGSTVFQSAEPALLQIDASSKLDGYGGRDPWTTAGLILKAHDPAERVAIIGVDGERNGTYQSATVIVRW